MGNKSPLSISLNFALISQIWEFNFCFFSVIYKNLYLQTILSLQMLKVIQPKASKASTFPRSSQNIIIPPLNYAPNSGQEIARKHGKSTTIVTNVGLGPTQKPPWPLS